jgi:hypothetical protein
MVVDARVHVAELGEPSGTVSMVNSRGSAYGTSSQVSGVETWAPGLAAQRVGERIVRSRAFWL